MYNIYEVTKNDARENDDNGALHAAARRHNREMHAKNGNIDFEIAQGESSADIGVRLKAKICNDVVKPQLEYVHSEADTTELLREAEKLRQYKFSCRTKYPSAMGTLHYTTGLTNIKIMSKWKNISAMINALDLKCDHQCKTFVAKSADEADDEEDEEEEEKDMTIAELKAFEHHQLEVKKLLHTKMLSDINFATFFMNFIMNRGVEELSSVDEPCDCQLMKFHDELKAWGIGPNGDFINNESESKFFSTVIEANIGQIQDSMRWVTVGQERYRNDDKFKHTSITTDYKEGGRADWRALGLRVALYDDLRECRITMPSGVEWSAPAKQQWRREIVFSSAWGDKWDYEAIFIDKGLLEAAMEGDKIITVLKSGQSEESEEDLVRWNLADDSTTLIVVNEIDTGTMPSCGKEMWILSHLSYPLAGVAEGFQMGYLTGNKHRHCQYFFRNSGLVDMALGSRKIVFVSTVKSSRIVIGGKRFVVTLSIGNRKPTIYKFDETLKALLTTCLRHTMSLKRDFSEYAFTFFKGDMDWVEVELLTSYITTRWVPQPEVTTDGTTDRLHWFLTDSDNLYRRGRGVLPTNCRSFGNFGHLDGVLGFDHVVAPWEKSQHNPVIWVGSWTTEAEYMLGLGSGQYCAVVYESQFGMYNRLRAGGWDRLYRGCLMRIAFEEWKRATSLTEEICCPHAYEGIDKHWKQLVTEERIGNCVESIAKMMCTPMVRWSWQINKQHRIRGTHTGIRGCVHWSNSWLTVGWAPFNFDDDLSGRVQLSTTRNCDWTFDCFVRDGYECHEEKLDWALMRLDVNQWRGQIKYKLAENREKLSYAYRCESKATDRMYKWLGWEPLNDEKGDEVKDGYGWGLRSHIQIWNVDHYEHATIVLSKESGLAIQQTVRMEGTHLTGRPKQKTETAEPKSQPSWGWELKPEDVLLRYRGDCSYPREIIVGKLIEN